MTMTCRRRGPAHPERDAEILRRWEEKEASGDIAAALRITRNTVLGVVCRAGKQRREGTRPQCEGGRKGAVRARAERVIKIRKPVPAAVLAPAPVSPVEIAEDIPPEFSAPPIGQRRTILTLSAGECRWPIGDPGNAEFFFCGDRIQPGFSYCGRHCRMAYRPIEPRLGGGIRPRFRTGAFSTGASR